MSATAVERFIEAYGHLDAAHLALLDEIYHPDIVFIDPFHRLEGLAALHTYFSAMFANVRSCQFLFDAPRVCGDEAFLRWRMHFAHPRLAGGRNIEVPGISHLRFDPATAKAVFHEDFYDAGVLLYEHVPVLGSAVRWLKHRMSQ